MSTEFLLHYILRHKIFRADDGGGLEVFSDSHCRYLKEVSAWEYSKAWFVSLIVYSPAHSFLP